MTDDAHYSLLMDPSLDGNLLFAALVWAVGMPSCPRTESVPSYLAELLSRVRSAGEAFLSPERKAAVRNMLRHGKYKPAGRSKPSSEYLLAAALAGEFPLVNGPVDANNAVSLEWGYPASIFDLAKTGERLLLRRGAAGESYVFNPSGQEIDLEDLLVICRPVEGPQGPLWSPCGNPVKDAMATKVFEDARDVVAVVYAPAADARSGIEACAARFAELLETECGAAGSGFVIGG
ncbi:MAG: phenylalanine--tRNA ligase beta subunit-related protein [Rectinemataceae bacterium]